MEESFAIFYSKNSNKVLASNIKEILNRHKIFTAYITNIDDVIMQKFTGIKFLILDLICDKLDCKSVELLHKLNYSGYIRNLIIISDNIDVDFCPCIKYDSNFPLRFSEVINRLLLNIREDKKILNLSSYKIVGDYLLSIGFSLKQIGYTLLIDSVIYVMSNKCILKNLTTDLYIYLANKYDKKVSSIEMNIRKAISQAYLKNKNFPFEYSPTNKEFITYLVTVLYEKIFTIDS